MRRTGICGALETLLIDAAYPGTRDLLAAVAATGCELRGDDAVRALSPDALPATAEDWDTEYLAPVLSAAIVDGPEAALDHIARHSRSEEHTSELQSLMRISYAVFCLKKKNNTREHINHYQ